MRTSLVAMASPKNARMALIAEQIKALMARHKIDNARELAKRTAETQPIAVDYTTIDRWRRGEAKTEPRADKLRAVAESVGETLDEAFPEKPQVVVHLPNGKTVIIRAGDDGTTIGDLNQAAKKLVAADTTKGR